MATIKLKVAQLLRQLFIEKSEVCPSEAHRYFKLNGRRTTYLATCHLFYDFRQLGLIEFSHSEPSKAPLDKRYFRIIAGKENDGAWDSYPHHLLYPSSLIGALDYEPGMSQGRAKEYEKAD